MASSSIKLFTIPAGISFDGNGSKVPVKSRIFFNHVKLLTSGKINIFIRQRKSIKEECLTFKIKEISVEFHEI